MGFRYFGWFLKGAGKRPNGSRLPIGVGGGQVVLDSHVQTPLGLQAQEALVTPLATELGRPNQLNECRTIRLVDLVAVPIPCLAVGVTAL